MQEQHLFYHNMTNQKTLSGYETAGLINIALRWVVGWTYFSALWRRTILATKLDPDTAGYVGEKFNHFLPNALGIKPMIEYLVTHPDVLWWFMVVFSILEGVVGLAIILGLFTRLMSVGLLLLAMGILLGSGWIGTTCLDEWQIGVLGITIGFILFLSGSSYYSIDQKLLNKGYGFTQKKWFIWLASGDLPIQTISLKRISVVGATAFLLITLFTNQIFHGGVWGELHNKSVRPKIEITAAEASEQGLSFQIYRTEGVDVYGSFLFRIAVFDVSGLEQFRLEGSDLGQLSASQIDNAYVAKVKPGKHSLIVPLGSKAIINLFNDELRNLPQGTYDLVLTDISGISWTSSFVK